MFPLSVGLCHIVRTCSHDPFKIRKDGYADDQDCDADDATDDREGDADKNADDDVRKGSKRVATS